MCYRFPHNNQRSTAHPCVATPFTVISQRISKSRVVFLAPPLQRPLPPSPSRHHRQTAFESKVTCPRPIASARVFTLDLRPCRAPLSGPVAPSLAARRAALSGPVAASAGLVAALDDPIAAPTGLVAALDGPVAAPTGLVATFDGPIAATSSPVAVLPRPRRRPPPPF
ncbi:unnamed protein product [Closterium sp. NIES-53]